MTDKAYVNGITWSPWIELSRSTCPDFAKELPLVPCSYHGNPFYPPQDLVESEQSAVGKNFHWDEIKRFRIPMDDFCRLTGLDFVDFYDSEDTTRYIAQDTNGSWYGYEAKPSLDLGYWQGAFVTASLTENLCHPKTICHECDTLICVDDYKEYLGLAEDGKEEIVADDAPNVIDELGHYETGCSEIIEIFDIQGYLAIGQRSGGVLDIFHAGTGLIWQNGYGWVNDDDKIIGKSMTYSDKAKLLHPEIPWDCFEDNVDRVEYLSPNSAFIGNATYTERVPHTIKIPRYWSDGSEITDVVIHRNYEDN